MIVATHMCSQNKTHNNCQNTSRMTMPLNCKLPSKRIYPLSREKQLELDKWLKEELGKGFIRPSKFPTVAPIFFVKKKDGTWRPVIDYRGLDNITIRNWYPLPLIPNLLDQLLGARFFTKYDVQYLNQIPQPSCRISMFLDNDSMQAECGFLGREEREQAITLFRLIEFVLGDSYSIAVKFYE